MITDQPESNESLQHKKSLTIVDPNALVNAMNENASRTSQAVHPLQHRPPLQSTSATTALINATGVPTPVSSLSAPATNQSQNHPEESKPKKKRVRPSRSKKALAEKAAQQAHQQQQMIMMPQQGGTQQQTLVVIQTSNGQQTVMVKDGYVMPQPNNSIRQPHPIVLQQPANGSTGAQIHGNVVNVTPQVGVGTVRMPTPAYTHIQDPEAAKWKRKLYYLKKAVRALVIKNSALCDEVARLHQRVATTKEERKIILKRLLHHEKLRQRREANAIRRQEARAQAAAQQAQCLSLNMIECHSTMMQRPMLGTPVQNMSFTGDPSVMHQQGSMMNNPSMIPISTSSYQQTTASGPMVSTTRQPSTTSSAAITADMIEHGDLNEILED